MIKHHWLRQLTGRRVYFNVQFPRDRSPPLSWQRAWQQAGMVAGTESQKITFSTTSRKQRVSTELSKESTLRDTLSLPHCHSSCSKATPTEPPPNSITNWGSSIQTPETIEQDSFKPMQFLCWDNHTRENITLWFYWVLSIISPIVFSMPSHPSNPKILLKLQLQIACPW